MSLSNNLEQTIKIVYDQMMARVEHNILPANRQAIYHILNSNDSFDGRLAFKWLAIITARYVLPIWQNAMPADSASENLIDMAEAVLKKRVSLDVAKMEANKVWEKMENLGATDEGMAVEGAFYAGQAAIEALMETLGKDPFKDIIINNDSTDSDLDPWSSDTAHWAVAAYVTHSEGKGSEPSKRREFWKWWLQDAIPQALKLSTI